MTGGSESVDLRSDVYYYCPNNRTWILAPNGTNSGLSFVLFSVISHCFQPRFQVVLSWEGRISVLLVVSLYCLVEFDRVRFRMKLMFTMSPQIDGGFTMRMEHGQVSLTQTRSMILMQHC